MKKALLTFLLACSITIPGVATASNPVIVGEISGMELCPESVCDAAIFTGTCGCLVNQRHTVGFFWVAI